MFCVLTLAKDLCQKPNLSFKSTKSIQLQDTKLNTVNIGKEMNYSEMNKMLYVGGFYLRVN